MRPRFKASIVLPIFCAVALALSVGLSHPILEMGLDDDWSYIWSARVLADTGHVVYNGWATAMLSWQLYFGAFFIKLFGFSFTIVRLPVVLLSMLTAALMQRLFVWLGLNEWNSTIATLTFVLSPVFLPLSCTFMSDVPGLLCLLVCLYCCVRAIQSSTDNAVLMWLVLAASSNVVGGTVRQIAWLGALVLVPSTGWWLRRRSGVLLTTALLWCASVVAIIACMRWFNAQPYSLAEHMFQAPTGMKGIAAIAVSLIRNTLALLLFVLPVTMAFVVKLPWKRAYARRQMMVGAGALCVVAVMIALVIHIRVVHGESVRAITPFSNNLVTARGMVDLPILLGHRPDVVSVTVRAVLFVLIFASILAWYFVASNGRVVNPSLHSPTMPSEESSTAVSPRAIAVLLGPLSLAYFLLLVTRSQIYDRYLLLLFFVLLVVVVRLYQRKLASRLPAASIVLMLLFAAFGVASLHDLFSMDRARLAAADELRAAGVPRDQLRIGFEYDAWTQLERTGYVNDPRLRVPAGAYREAAPDPPSACSLWFDRYTPDLNARFSLSYEPGTCEPSTFLPVPYSTWLAPHDRMIYIERLQ